MNKISFETLGCKLNQSETERLAIQVLDSGYQLAESPQEADVHIVNTCTVTHIADRKSRHLLRSARHSNPELLIIATGCYAQRAPRELKKLGIVDLVLDNTNKNNLAGILEDRLESKGNKQTGQWSRTRSLIKIQEGCNDFCSFCIVPYTRGREHSLPLDEIVEEVRTRSAAGYKEITLTGTKIGAYRQNGGNPSNLSYLVKKILKETEIERVRLSSLQPQDITPEFVKLWADNRLCPHFHIPLQSGSEAILQRMGRGYCISDYRKAISLVREAIPDAAITTDILAGFPGEGEKEFEESYGFCEETGFAGIHVFPYSPRTGTRAATMPDQVDERVKKGRSQKMLTLAQRSAGEFREQFLGRTMPVLWEKETDPGTWNGLTNNYIRVFTRTRDDLTNRLLPTRIIADHTHWLMGEVIAKKEGTF